MPDKIPFDSINKVTEKIIHAAIEVHRILGPGFLESIYEDAFCYELDLRNVPYQRQFEIDITYKDKIIKGQRLDVLVENIVIVELKAISEVKPIHKEIMISYLKATSLRIGLLINFHESLLKDGIHRILLPEKYIKQN
jgi:GxxExxY protein